MRTRLPYDDSRRIVTTKAEARSFSRLPPCGRAQGLTPPLAFASTRDKPAVFRSLPLMARLGTVATPSPRCSIGPIFVHSPMPLRPAGPHKTAGTPSVDP
jgi:hypothetical protein